MPEVAVRRYSVVPFKGLWAVMDGARLVTRTASENAAIAYAASCEKAAADRKPTATAVAPVDAPPEPARR